MTELLNTKTAFVFPGQGSQYVGMGKALHDSYPFVRDVFKEAEEVLGFDMERLCFEDPEGRLDFTSFTQPAILTVSIAALKAFRMEVDLEPAYLAGHSLGEFTAFVAAEVISFTDALRIVHKRGIYMQDAVPPDKGGMAAIIGLEKGIIEELCQEASRDEEIVVPANYNSPVQIVISGNREAVNRAVIIARERGAKKAIMLNVSVPSHSPYMDQVAKRLGRDMEGVTFHSPKAPIVTNLIAQPVSSPSILKEQIIKQLTNPVRWEESLVTLRDKGVNRFIEIGPGKVLTGLVKRTIKGAEVYSMEGISDLKVLL